MTWWRLFTYLEALAIAALAVLTVFTTGVAAWYLGGALLVLVIVHVTAPHQWGGRTKKPALGAPKPEVLDRADLVRAERYVDRYYSINAADHFRRVLLDLPSFLSRVDQRMELEGRSGKIETTLVFRRVSTSVSLAFEAELNEKGAGDALAESESILVPLVGANKGLLFDGFVPFDESGKTLPTLSQWEIRGLLFVALRAMLTNALNPGELKLTKQDRHKLVWIAERTICLPAATAKNKDQVDKSRQEAEQLFGELEATGRFEKAALGKIRSVCESIASDYLIVVEVPRKKVGSLVVGYRHEVTAAEVSRNWEHRRRAKHGLAPVVVDAPMSWALSPDSFHFELHAPPGQYVFDHHLEAMQTDHILRQGDFEVNGVQQYVRLHHEHGHTLAHLYVRRVRYNRDPVLGADQSATEVRPDVKTVPDFKSVVRFKEIPPGVLASAVTVALFTFVVVTFYAFFKGPLDKQSSTVVSQATLTLLLTVPAFLAAGLGRGISSDKLPGTSLTTFFGLWAIVVVSLTAALAFLVDANKVEWLTYTREVFGVLLELNYLWTILSVASLVIFIVLRKEKSDQLRYYLRILRKSGAGKQAKNHL